MSRVNFDFKNFDRFTKNFEKLQKEFDPFCRRFLLDQAMIALADTKACLLYTSDAADEL